MSDPTTCAITAFLIVVGLMALPLIAALFSWIGYCAEWNAAHKPR